MAVDRVIPLTLGWAEVSESVSILGGSPWTRIREPVPAVLVRAAGQWVLVDTGYNTPLVRDPHLHARFFGRDPSTLVELPPGGGDPLEEALEGVGLAISDISVVALSHLHYDHVGGLRAFAGRVPVHCQRRELDYALGDHPEPERQGIHRVDFDDPEIDWRLADGDTEIIAGVTALASYGHTPGHQSFAVEFAAPAAARYGVPGLVFAFDAADLQRNIDEEVAPGGLLVGGEAEAVSAIRRLKALAAARGYLLVPGHDPDVWHDLSVRLGADVGST